MKCRRRYFSVGENASTFELSCYCRGQVINGLSSSINDPRSSEDADESIKARETQSNVLVRFTFAFIIERTTELRPDYDIMRAHEVCSQLNCHKESIWAISFSLHSQLALDIDFDYELPIGKHSLSKIEASSR